jgi:hypothetical protein
MIERRNRIGEMKRGKKRKIREKDKTYRQIENGERNVNKSLTWAILIQLP